MNKSTEEINKNMEKKKTKPKRQVEIREKIPTGSDLLDIAMEGGWDVGGISQLYADSTGGKTLFAVEMIYQALLRFTPKKTKYRYNDTEAGNTFPTEERYGYPLLKSNRTLIHSPIIEDCKADILDFCDSIEEGGYGVYINDSQDFMYSKDDQKRTEDERKSYKKNGTATTVGTYGNRAKKLKEAWRHCAIPAYENNVHIMIISQIMDNIGAGLFEKKTKVTGGHGTKFAASKKFEIKRVAKLGPKGREYGFRVCVILEKTRTKYEGRRVYIDIMNATGFDNVRSNLIFLYDILDEGGKEVPAKTAALKWEDSYSAEDAGEAEAIPGAAIKQFFIDNDWLDDVGVKHGKKTVANMKKYLSETPEAMNAFVKEFGVMSLDDLAVYIEQNELEEELTRRVKMKWDWLETKDAPSNRKERPKLVM